MEWGKYSFGAVHIDGREYNKDVVLDRGVIRKRNKKASKGFKERFGHTPLSLKEDIPWNCHRLLIGTGVQGRLPVMEEVRAEAGKRGWRSRSAPRRRPSKFSRRSRPKPTPSST